MGSEAFYEGNFSFIYGGIMLNPLGQVLASADFDFTDDPGNDLNGLFVGSGVNAVRNIVFEQDMAPGFSDAKFMALGYPILADNGNVFFTSTLSGTDVSSVINQTLWMEDDGVFSLLMQEGTDAPGLPGEQIRLTALNMHAIAYNGSHLVVFAGSSTPGGDLKRVFWSVNTDGTGFTPIFYYDSYPVLTSEDSYTTTDQGAVVR